MKLLMFQASRFHYAPFEKTLDAAPACESSHTIEAVAVIFVHAEAEDQHERTRVMTKAVKNVKWIAGKRKLDNVALHSFTHLSESRADPSFARDFLDELGERLTRSGFSVWQTPFGYTCEWELSVYGPSLAKVFKSI